MNGRKRVPLVDKGLIHAIRVVPALMQDRDTPAVIEPELANGSLRKVWPDLAVNGEAATAPMTCCGIELALVLWLACTGAPWRDLPLELGNWNSV